jgi:hypothetical protein
MRKEGRKQRHRRNYRNEEGKEEWWQDRLMKAMRKEHGKN